MDFTGMDPKDARKAQRGWDLAAKHRIERAAPDLLTALEWITRCAKMSGPAGTTAYFIADERMAAAKAAVLKAKGGTR